MTAAGLPFVQSRSREAGFEGFYRHRCWRRKEQENRHFIQPKVRKDTDWEAYCMHTFFKKSIRTFTLRITQESVVHVCKYMLRSRLDIRIIKTQTVLNAVLSCPVSALTPIAIVSLFFVVPPVS